MIFTVKDLEMLLDKAVEVGRDLQLSINADGTYDVYFNIPTKYTMITTHDLKADMEDVEAVLALKGGRGGQK